MRIGIFTETYTPYISGLVTSVVMLKGALEKMGHTVYVVTANLDKYTYEYDEEEKVLKIPGIPTGIYDSRLTSIYPVTAINKIKSWKLDVIHSQTEFAIGSFARLIGKRYNIPVVHTYHTMYEDYVHYITKGHFKKSSIKLVEYLTLFYCDKTITELIVPTKKAYDLFKQKYNVKRNIYIVPTGIEVERFYRENIDEKAVKLLKKDLGISKKDFVFIFVGRLAEEKNVEFLLEVMQELDNNNLKLLIVGDGPDKEKYEKISKNNGTSNIIFTGKVPWDMVPIYYGASDGFITASKTETQGLTVIEAMAASLPVLCIDDESFHLSVVEGCNGFFFKDKEECKKYMLMLMKNKSLYEEISKGAKSNAMLHSSKHFASQILEVYSKAIDTQKQKASTKFLNFIERFKIWKK